jgi:hypothetical protein
MVDFVGEDVDEIGRVGEEFDVEEDFAAGEETGGEDFVAGAGTEAELAPVGAQGLGEGEA